MSTHSTSKKQAGLETVAVPSTSTAKSAASAKSSTRSCVQKEQTTSRPTRAPRSLREKVLTRTTSLRSSLSEDIAEQTPLIQPPSPSDVAAQRIASWEQQEIPPRPSESDDDFSEGSSISGNVTAGRPSMVYFTTRRTAVEMDAATKQANDMLQKAKDALEAAGNMKRECKLTTIECLQTMYETVLSLSDSRSRHKYNLEKERQRHAQELVRVERAHNKILTDTLTDISNKISNTQKDITENREETKAIRSWLGYETQEPYTKIKEIAKVITNLERSITELAVNVSTSPKYQTERGTTTTSEKNFGKISSRLDTLSNQLDELRRSIDKVKAGTDLLHNTGNLPKETTSDQRDHTAMHRNEETIKIGLAEVKEAIKTAEKTICQKIATQKVPQVNPSSEGLKEHLKPITERLEAVSSELRTMRETRNDIAPVISSIEAEIALAERKKLPKPTYAQMAQKARVPQPNHTLIVSSTDPQKTGENVIDSIRVALDLKNSGAKIDRVRKGRNQKVILSCNTKEDLSLVKNKIKTDNNLRTEVPKVNNPLARVKDVLTYHTDSEIVKYILSQNAHLLEGIREQDRNIRVRYRKKARNPLECHLVLELSPEVHKRLIDAGKIYIDLQRRPIEDQSPLVQCSKCLGFGHTKTLCREPAQLCSYCGGAHTWDECSRRTNGQPPTCKNCQKIKNTTTHEHIAFSGECPEKQKWDAIARSRITYC